MKTLPIAGLFVTFRTAYALIIPKLQTRTCANFFPPVFSSSNDSQQQHSKCTPLDPAVAGQFQIITCSSTACTKRSKAFGLDEYALFSGIYERKEENGASDVQVEEGTCMGRCKFGPCVGIKHEDYEGMVGLEGMMGDEFQYRVFQNIVTEGDLDRVWSSVENAIRIMAEEEGEDD